MIKKTILYVLLMGFSCIQIPAWANSPEGCVYEHSGVNLKNFKTSKHVAGFEQIERNKAYIGSLKGIGGFHLQLFSCAHYGAKLTVLLGSTPSAETLTKTLDVLPGLLFSPADLLKVKAALNKVRLDDLLTPLHMQQLANEMGMTDIRLQINDVDGVRVLVFVFYEG